MPLPLPESPQDARNEAGEIERVWYWRTGPGGYGFTVSCPARIVKRGPKKVHIVTLALKRGVLMTDRGKRESWQFVSACVLADNVSRVREDTSHHTAKAAYPSF